MLWSASPYVSTQAGSLVKILDQLAPDAVGLDRLSEGLKAGGRFMDTSKVVKVRGSFGTPPAEFEHSYHKITQNDGMDSWVARPSSA